MREKAAALLRIAERMHHAFTATIATEMDAAQFGDGGVKAHEFLSAVLMALASTAGASIAVFAHDQAAASVVVDELSEMVRYKTRIVLDSAEYKRRGLQ